MAVPELMRILLDEAKLGWDQAWDLTVRTLAYTNHTLLPEALEKWPVELFEALLPRHLEIIYEINRRFLDDVQAKHPGDDAKLARVSLIEETPARKVRMANLAIVGTHSTNGVAAIHSELLRTKTVPDFAELFPERFNNKTNGVTPRRWLLPGQPRPGEAAHRGDRRRLGHRPVAASRRPTRWPRTRRFQKKFLAAKRRAKARFVDWIKATAGITLDPDTLFDVPDQAHPRVQAATAERDPVRRLVQPAAREPEARRAAADGAVRRQGGPGLPPGQGHHQARSPASAEVVNADPATRGKLRVEFLPNYSCTLAEHLIPAADVSEQISTAGYEASGTSNMKFMMNGRPDRRHPRRGEHRDRRGGRRGERASCSA